MAGRVRIQQRSVGALAILGSGPGRPSANTLSGAGTSADPWSDTSSPVGSGTGHNYPQWCQSKRGSYCVGGSVTFVNNDTIPHDIMGGPDPSRPDCHEIDSVAFLTPGQSRQTAPFPSARTCEYHDHSFHSLLFNGRIVIQ